MDAARLLASLDADVARLRTVAARDLAAPVPTCPGWTVADLVRHVANIYLNIVVRRLRMPEDIPRQDLSGEQPIAALDRCYAAMTGEVAVRDPDDHVGREPNETVHFWIRRMTHETAIHRVDAELALADPIAPIPEDLAIDGIDEMLTSFLAEVTRRWPEEFAADLHDWADRWVLVSAGGAGWCVTVRPNGAEVTRADGQRGADQPVAASIRGEPATLMCWLYNRGGADLVKLNGDNDLITQLRRLLTAVTNTG